MRENQLLAEIEQQIFIERGLKMLEFITEYQFKKAEYRANGPTSFKLQDQQQCGQQWDLMAEMNGQLVEEKSEEELKLEAPVNELKVEAPVNELSKYVSSHSSNSNPSILESQHSKTHSQRSDQSSESLQQDQLQLCSLQNSDPVNFSDFISYLSSSNSAKHMPVIEQVSAENNSLKSLNSLAQRLEISEVKKREAGINTSFSKMNKSSQVPQHFNQSLSIIRKVSRQPSMLNASKTESEIEILSNLSDSLNEKEKLELLVKLENVELQSNFLIKQIHRRLEKDSNVIKQVKSMKWENLKMPRVKIELKKFNYGGVQERVG